MSLTGGNNIEYQNVSLSNIEYVDIPNDTIDKIIKIVDIYAPALLELDFSTELFESFIVSFAQERGIDIDDISGSSLQDGHFYIFLGSGKHYSFSIDDINSHRLLDIVGSESLGQIQKRVDNINAAIESIYDANDGYFWDGDIEDDDVVEGSDFGSELEGKNLRELRELLEIDSQKLYQIYEITGETEKKEELLMLELQFFAGIGDRYEGGAHYFALSSMEIGQKVRKLISHMSNEEIFSFIRDTNQAIEDNYKKSDMVNQVNLKLISALYKQTLERLQNTGASNRDFIEFAKLVTGRGTLLSQRGDDYEYSEIEIDSAFKDIDMANKAMIHIMYRENGILDNISEDWQNKNQVQIEDEELDGRSPKSMVEYAARELNTFGAYQDQTGEEMIQSLGFGDLIGIDIPYNELDFNQKVNLGALARLVKAAQDITKEEVDKDPQIIRNKLMDSFNNSFNDLNTSLSDNFNASWTDWNGISASELGLNGDLAEIFNLYQEINGNWGALHFSDKTADFITPSLRGTLVLGFGMLSAGICMSLLAAGAPVIAIIAAGAAAGAVTGLITQIAGRQGYDNIPEAIVDTIAVMGTDAAVGALFFLGSVKFFKNFFKIDILAENFFTKVNFLDMLAFGGAETLANSMITSPFISTIVKSWFPDFHFDTDQRAIAEQLQQLAELENN